MGLHFHFSFSCIGEGNGNPLQCSCLENPRDGGAWWAAVYGVAQSRTRLKRRSSRNEKLIMIISNAVISLSNTRVSFLYPFYQRGWVPSCTGSAARSGLCVSGGFMLVSQQMHHMEPASWAWSYAGGWESKNIYSLDVLTPKSEPPSRWSLFKVLVNDNGPGVST